MTAWNQLSTFQKTAFWILLGVWVYIGLALLTGLLLRGWEPSDSFSIWLPGTEWIVGLGAIGGAVFGFWVGWKGEYFFWGAILGAIAGSLVSLVGIVVVEAVLLLPLIAVWLTTFPLRILLERLEGMMPVFVGYGAFSILFVTESGLVFAKAHALARRDRATVLFEQAISQGRRGAIALERGNLQQAKDSLEQARQSLVKADEMATEQELRENIKVNLKSVRTNQMLALLNDLQAEGQKAAADYQKNHYGESIVKYQELVRALAGHLTTAQQEGLEVVVPHLMNALSQAREGLAASETARDAARVETLAQESQKLLQQAQALAADHDYTKAREPLLQARNVLEQAEALAETRAFSEALGRLAEQRSQVEAFRDEINMALRGGIPITRTGPMDFGGRTAPRPPQLEEFVTPASAGKPQPTTPPQDPTAAFRNILLACVEARQISPDIPFDFVFGTLVQTAPESARPYLERMWQMHFLGEQELGKIAVIQGRTPEFLALLEAQSDVTKAVVQELRRLPSLTGEDLLRVLNRVLGGAPTPEELNAIRQGARRSVQQARTGFPPQLLSVFDRPAPLLSTRGGFATVFRAYHRQLQQEVAVKIPSERTPEAGRTFINEASLWTDLHHPNIVEIVDHSAFPFPYIAMEFMVGGDLQRRLSDRGAPFTIPEVSRLLLPIAQAVRYAHDRAILHGDIKASNILLAADGTPKLADWGMARRVAARSRLMPAYTPEYAAPEQLRNEGRSLKTDVYHLGGILYHLTTGKAPYDGFTSEEHLRALVLDSPAPKPSTADPSLRPLDDLVAQCMARDPFQRLTIAQACEALEKLAG